MRYIGEYHHQIDEKGRIRIPPKFKAQLGDNPFIMRGTNGCLFVLPENDAFEMLDAKFGGSDALDPSLGKSMRLLASSGFIGEEDKAGRILLPQKLIKHAKLKKNVVTLGAYTHVEIWDEDTWNEYSNVDGDGLDECLSEFNSSLNKARSNANGTDNL